MKLFYEQLKNSINKSPNLHWRATTKTNLAEELTGEESATLYQEAITELETLVQKKELPPRQHANDLSWLARTKTLYAEEHLEGETKEQTLKEAINAGLKEWKKK